MNRLRFLLFPPAFALAFLLMLPALIREGCPPWHWPAAVLYGLFVGGHK
jgi:hypothetical protein